MPDADPDLVALLLERREAVCAEIAELSSGDVALVAVTKTHPAAVVVAALAAGFVHFGESYAGELVEKAEALSAEHCDWQFIGQLQTNKVRRVAPYVSLYQSVDRPSLVAELSRRVPAARVLIEVDLAEIAGRGGVSVDDAPALIESARASGLVVAGVMGVAPNADVVTVGAAFRRLRRLADLERLPICSMGMSGDYRLALAEGSTMLRLGSALFGPRI